MSDDDLLTDLRRVASEQSEQQVKQHTYKDHGKYGVTAAIRCFGSWNSAVKAAGLETPIERNIPNEQLFLALYDLWITLGRQPTYSEVQRPVCKFHVATCERCFGSGGKLWKHSFPMLILKT
ncbi:homing endonuclease associated repeat-containing protein [Nitrosomonas communis]|uniref:homing endonuclease associated repeat-containing protein n=1 Tax=Nitrosomonas communis TaxID=44574 RepID=UPI003527ADDF